MTLLTAGVQVAEEDRKTLQSWSRSTSLRAGLVIAQAPSTGTADVSEANTAAQAAQNAGHC
jgi:hypothetical protein